MAKVNHLKFENRIMVCREYAQLWQAFFQFFSDTLEDVVITEQMEREFEQVMTMLTLNYYKFSELCGEYMKDVENILKIISTAVSLKNIQSMQEATAHKLRLEWHETFIDMNKALGKLLQQLTPKRLAEMNAAQGQNAA